MAKVVIYSKDICPYCTRAKTLLQMLGQEYEEINIDKDTDKVAEMLEKTNGARTVPQIFINDEHVGGSDDLQALHSADKLKPMLDA